MQVTATAAQAAALHPPMIAAACFCMVPYCQLLLLLLWQVLNSLLLLFPSLSSVAWIAATQETHQLAFLISVTRVAATNMKHRAALSSCHYQ